MLTSDSDRWFVRSAMLAAVGALVVAASIGLSLFRSADHDEVVSPPPPAREAAAPAPASGAALPSFDVVRVMPSGDAVIAGRGTAGATVSVRAGEQMLGTVTADSHGEWVLVPEKPLPAGSHRLFAELHDAQGTSRRSVEDVLVVIPDRTQPDSPSRPLVLRMMPDGSSSLLAAPAAGTGSGPLSIDRLAEDDAGRVELAGRAEAWARVRLRVDGRPVGEVQADAAGVWRLPLARRFAPGTSTLTAEQLDRRGSVAHRTDVPVTFPAERPPADRDRVLVQAGDNLWQIAREVYGRGAAFTVIFAANRAQIEDPDRIYPGQRFQLPASSPAATAAGQP